MEQKDSTIKRTAFAIFCDHLASALQKDSTITTKRPLHAIFLWSILQTCYKKIASFKAKHRMLLCVSGGRNSSAVWIRPFIYEMHAPNRRFWKAEQTFQSVFSKHFSKVWVPYFQNPSVGMDKIRHGWSVHSKSRRKAMNCIADFGCHLRKTYHVDNNSHFLIRPN